MTATTHQRWRDARAKNRIEGFCVYARSHGPARPGRATCERCAEKILQRKRDAYRSAHPNAGRNKCGVCDSTEHNARRCPARREQENA